VVKAGVTDIVTRIKLIDNIEHAHLTSDGKIEDQSHVNLSFESFTNTSQHNSC